MADQKPKIGAGHASAMFRQGLRELRAAFFPDSNIAQPTEHGIFGTKTPGEVADSRQPGSQASRMDQEPVATNKQRSPSDIAADARNEQRQEHGNAVDHGHDTGKTAGHSPARSPSQIAADRSGPVPEQQQEHDLSHGL